MTRVVRRGHDLDVRRLGALGARGAARAPPGPRLLLPVPLPAGRDRSAAPNRPAPGSRCDAELRVGVVPGLRLRLLLVVPAHRRGRHRLRPPPRRLRLRVRHRPQRRPSGDAGPRGRRALAGRTFREWRMQHALHKQRPAAPAHPPPVPVRRHVGRPRGLQRLRQHPRLQRRRRRLVAAAAYQACWEHHAGLGGGPLQVGEIRASTAGCRAATCCRSTCSTAGSTATCRRAGGARRRPARRRTTRRSACWAADRRMAVRRPRRSDARWTVLGNNVMVARLDHDGDLGDLLWNDAWDGFPAARNRLARPDRPASGCATRSS